MWAMTAGTTTPSTSAASWDSIGKAASTMSDTGTAKAKYLVRRVGMWVIAHSDSNSSTTFFAGSNPEWAKRNVRETAAMFRRHCPNDPHPDGISLLPDIGEAL
jgi:hypothetical protein